MTVRRSEIESGLVERFDDVLRAMLRRPEFTATPGLLAKLSGLPKATIVNWLEGRVKRPRREGALAKLTAALRLTPGETRALYTAAGYPAPPHPAPPALEHLPVGVYCTTPDGRILYANETLIRLLGYDDFDEYRRLDVARDLYLDPAQRAVWRRAIDRTGVLHGHRTWARRADGGRLLVRDSASAVYDARGTVAHYEGVWECVERTNFARSNAAVAGRLRVVIR